MITVAPNPTTTPTNRTLYIGDNLEHLRQLPDGCVDLIATDPPFNTGHEFIGVVNGERVSFSDEGDLDAHLGYLQSRVEHLYRMLKRGGSLYLHLDDRTHAYTQIMLDSVFGRQHRRGQIIWRRYGSHNDTKNYGRVYDVLLYYTKGKVAVWNGEYTPLDEDYIKQSYRYSDQRGRYRCSDLCVSKGHQGNGYEYEFAGHFRKWLFPKERMKQLDEEERIHYPTKAGGVPQRRTYLDDSKGKAVSNLWDDINSLAGGYSVLDTLPKSHARPIPVPLLWIRHHSCGCGETGTEMGGDGLKSAGVHHSP